MKTVFNQEKTINSVAGRRGVLYRKIKELVVEKILFLISLSVITAIFCIFLFVGKESYPVIVGKTNSALVQELIKPEDIDKHSLEEIRAYLGLPKSKFKKMDRETIISLIEIKYEAYKEIPENFKNDKDAKINTTEWRYLILPHQWTGYDKPVYIWQPVSNIQKYNIIPLIVGSLKTTFVSLIFAIPISIAAAIYVSQLAKPSLRETLKPAIELLSGIPSVVVGFFALLVMASFFQSIFKYEIRLNAFVAGVALSFALIPIIFSIAEDALYSVPRSIIDGAYALGASKWQAAYQVCVPAALSGIFAAVLLGFGRAIGETMIVLMVTSASEMTWNIFEGARTITATIAAEMAEVVFQSPHYRILFLLGTLLFGFTFISNIVAQTAIAKFKSKYEGLK
ncbi:MAG: phosphate ABC transporter permease subunit PstC [Verrucomicrobiia bacterium]